MLAPLFSLSHYLMDGSRYTSTTTSTLIICPPTYSIMDKTDSASCAIVLMLPFILCAKPIPSMIQVDRVGIASAGDTLFTSFLASAAVFVFRRYPSAFVSAHCRGLCGLGRTLHVYTCVLSYQDHLAEEVSVCLQNHILAFHSGCLCADC